MTPPLTLIRGGRYGEPLPEKAAPAPKSELPKNSMLDHLVHLGLLPPERVKAAADSPFADFDDKVGA